MLIWDRACMYTEYLIQTVLTHWGTVDRLIWTADPCVGFADYGALLLRLPCLPSGETPPSSRIYSIQRCRSTLSSGTILGVHFRVLPRWTVSSRLSAQLKMNLRPNALLSNLQQFDWTNPAAYHIYGILVSQFGDLNDINSTSQIGETLSVKELIRKQYGYNHNFLWFVSTLSVAFPILLAFLFVVSIKYLSYQQRYRRRWSTSFLGRPLVGGKSAWTLKCSNSVSLCSAHWGIRKRFIGTIVRTAVSEHSHGGEMWILQLPWSCIRRADRGWDTPSQQREATYSTT